jgi:hypothetical protein
MSHLGALYTCLEERFPHTVKKAGTGSARAANRVHICFFRVNGQPAAAVTPARKELSPAELAEAIGGAQVERLRESELEETYIDTELGHMEWFENPFGATVYFDDSLLAFPEVVFCPEELRGGCARRRAGVGPCFCVPTEEFIALSRALVLPLGIARRRVREKPVTRSKSHAEA